MRSLDEQLNEILKRTDCIREIKRYNKLITIDALAACACLAMIIFAAGFYLNTQIGTEAVHAVNYGSLILSIPFAGFVIIGLLAFALGIIAALLCIHIREKKKYGRLSMS